MALGGSCQAPSGHLVLKMVTTMLCFHSDGTVPREKRSSNKFSKAACHHGDKTLKSEYGKPLSPTIELHTSGQAQWSSADVNGAPEAPSTGAHAGNSFEAAHGCFKRESSNGVRRLRSSIYEMLAPVCQRISLGGSWPADAISLVTSGVHLTKVCPNSRSACTRIRT